MDAILLTGASGYLGSRVAAALRRAGRPFSCLEGRLEEIRPGSLPFGQVLHCAGALRARASALHTANVLGMERLLAGLPRGAGIIHPSSRSVYPRAGHRLVDESAPVAPWDGYGESKLAAEGLLRASGHPWVILRCAALFGHPDREGTFPDHALMAALAGRPVTLATPDREEDYLDVEVLAELMVRALGTGAHWGDTMHGAGPARPLSAMLTALARVAGGGLSLRQQPMAVPEHPLLDITRMAQRFPTCCQGSDEAIFSRMREARARREKS